jgi:hypothetical protein
LIRDYAPAEIKDKSNREKIANWMVEHYKYIMQPENEWAGLRSFGFTWYLGYNVKSAFVNTTQIPLVTYPYLAARYSDSGAVASISRATKDLAKYWKNPSALTPGQQMLLHQGKVESWLDQSLATELAIQGTSGVVDRALPLDMAGKLSRREFKKLSRHFYYKVAHYGSALFHVTEKMNRNITALAAYDLALQQGENHEMAVARARKAVERTQYEYSRYNRPNFMRGKKGAIFLFQNYVQNTLFFALEEKGGMRYLLMLLMFAGLQGLPGAEDIMDMFDLLGTKFKEKAGLPNPKVDIRTQLRRDLAEFADTLGTSPDLFLKGLGSDSLGLGLLGRQFGLPMPNMDLTGSLSMGNIIPGTDMHKRLRSESAQEAVGRTLEEAGGALGSMGMNVATALLSKDLDTWRRFERAMPMAMKGLSRSLRYATDGAETTRRGDVIAEFDIHDRGDRADLALQAFSFTPRKLTKGWEGRIATQEVVGYYDAQKNELLNALNYARDTKDQDARADAMRAIKQFNNVVPYPEMKISGETIGKSWESFRRIRARTSRGIALQNSYLRLQKYGNESAYRKVG